MSLLKKGVICFIVLFVGLTFVTGCQKKEADASKEDEVYKDEGPNSKKIKVVADDDNVTIRYNRIEFARYSEKKENEGKKTFTNSYPSILLNITNKSKHKILLTVRASKKEGKKLDYSFDFINNERVIESDGVSLKEKEILDFNVIYRKSSDEDYEYSLSDLDNKVIYLSLYQYKSDGSKKYVKDYEIDTRNL